MIASQIQQLQTFNDAQTLIDWCLLMVIHIHREGWRKWEKRCWWGGIFELRLTSSSTMSLETNFRQRIIANLGAAFNVQLDEFVDFKASLVQSGWVMLRESEQQRDAVLAGSKIYWHLP
jgi:hypothetical protein